MSGRSGLVRRIGVGGRAPPPLPNQPARARSAPLAFFRAPHSARMRGTPWGSFAVSFPVRAINGGARGPPSGPSLFQPPSPPTTTTTKHAMPECEGPPEAPGLKTRAWDFNLSCCSRSYSVFVISLLRPRTGLDHRSCITPVGPQWQK